MHVNVKFFALGKDLVGAEELEYNLPGGAVVQTLLDELVRDYPRFAELKSFLVAVNMEYSNRDTELKNGDLIAIIPPVSGG